MTSATTHATFIRATAQRVYELIATSNGLDSWFTTGATVEPRPDGRIVFDWDAGRSAGVRR